MSGAPTIGGLKRLSLYLAGQLKNAVSITGGSINAVAITSSSIAATTATQVAVNISAAGTSQATATAVAFDVNNVSAVDGTKGVRLPSAVGSLSYEKIIFNTDASNGLKIYPATGDKINGGSANAAITIEGNTMAILRSLDTSSWGAIYTVNT